VGEKEKNMKVVLITGASSGIGYEAAQRLARRGCKVYAAARRVELMEPLRQEGIVPVRLDVCDEASMRQCVDSVLQAEGRIDVLVNNAGYGYFGAVENVSDGEARRQLEVNVFGLAAMCRLVLPHMRKQGSGRIVNTSSIAGLVVLPFGGWYHVSKYSVEALSDALRMELRPFGIKVSMIEPGGIKTDWGLIAADHLRNSSTGAAYEEAALAEADLLRKVYSGNYLTKPTKIARAIERAALSRRPRARYRLGRFSTLAVWTHRLLPARWWDALLLRFARIKL
jgi:NAD(P)-dependent dehydrogenase (short-subunit alcohol dehydrogenase family)